MSKDKRCRICDFNVKENIYGDKNSESIEYISVQLSCLAPGTPGEAPMPTTQSKK